MWSNYILNYRNTRFDRQIDKKNISILLNKFHNFYVKVLGDEF